MLSAETAAGKYPAEAVTLMARVALDVEVDPELSSRRFQPLANTSGSSCYSEGISQAACRLAENIDANAIVAFTQTGTTAALASKYRPTLPIFAVTPSLQVQRRLSLYAAVQAFLTNSTGTTETQIQIGLRNCQSCWGITGRGCRGDYHGQPIGRIVPDQPDESPSVNLMTEKKRENTEFSNPILTFKEKRDGNKSRN